MMEDPNLIACLFPADRNQKALQAIHLSENRGRYIPPEVETEPERGSRGSTVPREDDEDPRPNFTSYPGLQVTFNAGPKAGQSFVLGTDRNRCDIVLPRLGEISRRHCCLTFDAERRLILRDFSTNGTMVTYDGKGAERRHHFTWILSGTVASEIVIKIEKIEFQMIVSRHETHPGLYSDNVDRFLLQANSDDELSFGALGIQSMTSTAHQSGAHTPQTPIYIGQETLGRGAFSVVNRVWDVSTGLLYASKEFVNMKESQWRKEGSIMSKISEIPQVSGSFPSLFEEDFR